MSTKSSGMETPAFSGMEQPDFADEIQLLEGLRNRNIHAFIRLYKDYSEDLLVLAYTLVGEPTLASRAVDLLFTALWEKGMIADITSPIHRFLYTELRKICLP